MAGEEFAEAFGSALAEGIAQGLAAGLLLILLLAVSLLIVLVMVFLLGLQARPRTTLLAYGVGIVFHLIGVVGEIPPLFFVGMLLGAGIGWYRFEDRPVPFFQSRPYTWLLRLASGGSILAGALLTGKFLNIFDPYLLEQPGAAAVLLLLLALPILVGAYGLAGHRLVARIRR